MMNINGMPIGVKDAKGDELRVGHEVSFRYRCNDCGQNILDGERIKGKIVYRPELASFVIQLSDNIIYAITDEGIIGLKMERTADGELPAEIFDFEDGRKLIMLRNDMEASVKREPDNETAKRALMVLNMIVDRNIDKDESKDDKTGDHPDPC